MAVIMIAAKIELMAMNIRRTAARERTAALISTLKEALEDAGATVKPALAVADWESIS